MALCAYGYARDTYLFVGGLRLPGEQEWKEYLADLARFRDEPFGVLVLVDHGLPDMRRASVFQIAADASVERLVSVVSGETAVRDTVEIIDWLGVTIRWFPPSGVMAAMDFIGVPRDRVGAIWSRARDLERLIEGGVNAVKLADPFVRTALESTTLHRS